MGLVLNFSRKNLKINCTVIEISGMSLDVQLRFVGAPLFTMNAPQNSTQGQVACVQSKNNNIENLIETLLHSKIIRILFKILM